MTTFPLRVCERKSRVTFLSKNRKSRVQMNEESKTVLSVSEMARLVGLSRQRFHQLVGTIFPFPLYDVATRRPFYPEDLQQVCLEVRKRNCGINGRRVMFYSGHRPRDAKPAARRMRPAKKRQYVAISDGLTALGLSVRDDQVAAAVTTLFPSGIDGTPPGEVLREVFLFLKQKECRR